MYAFKGKNTRTGPEARFPHRENDNNNWERRRNTELFKQISQADDDK